MTQKELRETIELLRQLEEDNPADDTRIAMRKAELDEFLDKQIMGYTSPIIRSAWDMYYSQKGITFEHMLLEIVKAQHESLTSLRKSYEDHLMRNPNPVLFE